jgi:hypothetical protein
MRRQAVFYKENYYSTINLRSGNKHVSLKSGKPACH